MTQNPTPPSHRSRQRGQALAYVGVFLLAFSAATAVGVDIARIAFTASEAQAVADAAAMAGLRQLSTNISSGSTIDPRTVAVAVAAMNNMDGAASPMTVSDVELGTWDFNTRTFSAGGTPTSAVRAIANKTVNNFIASIIANPSTGVSRRATAALSSPNNGRPVWPIAVGECNFAEYQTSNDCSDLPTLTQSPNPSQSSCYTSFLDTSTNTGDVIQYLPTSCSAGGHAGQGTTGPSLSIGSNINLINGQITPILRVLEDCLQDGYTDWLIPIIPCTGNCNQAQEVVGFAEIRVDSIITNGRGTGVNMHAICKADEPDVSGGGGPNLGVTSKAMVE